MAKQQTANNNMLDVSALWGFNGETMELAERAYRTWLRGAETVQTQALDFWNAELQKGLDAMNEMARCSTAAEAFGIQTRYAQEAMQGLFAGSQKVIDQLATITQQPWADTTLIPADAKREENPASEGGKRASHGRSARR